jgi:hypothetical protein
MTHIIIEQNITTGSINLSMLKLQTQKEDNKHKNTTPSEQFQNKVGKW